MRGLHRGGRLLGRRVLIWRGLVRGLRPVVDEKKRRVSGWRDMNATARAKKSTFEGACDEGIREEGRGIAPLVAHGAYAV